MTAEVALALGKAAGRLFRARRPSAPRGDRQGHAAVGLHAGAGADRRASSRPGMNVMLVGPMPTPAVAFLTRSLRADLGVMISASHNPYHDNGIKLFGPDGFKLSDEIEDEIEALMAAARRTAWPAPADLGRAQRIDDARGRYIESLKSSFPTGLTLDGLKIVVDSAHGAAYHLAGDLFLELGAEVVRLGTEPNGLNINDGCGSNEPDAAARDACCARGPISGSRSTATPTGWSWSTTAGNSIDGDQLLAPDRRSWRADGGVRGGGRRRDGDVEPRARALPRRARPGAAPHQGRRPLRGRADARRRLQRRRRAVGPHRPVRLRHHRRRPAGGAAGAGGAAPARPAGERGHAGVRAGAAAAAQRADRSAGSISRHPASPSLLARAAGAARRHRPAAGARLRAPSR